ncbi:MAG: radical SAM protein [Planctomycetes bacterium]|nr:radical SAM protein [Planctomycetota bacterium]
MSHRPLARALKPAELAGALLSQCGDERQAVNLARRLKEWLFKFHAMSAAEIAERFEVARAKRRMLEAGLRIEPLLVLEQALTSPYDGSCRMVLRLRRESEAHYVEAVAIPRRRDLTLCLSSQVGCPLACSFCATGLLGLRQNLTAAEMVEEHAWAERLQKQRVTDIVFMGMGEPLLNYDAVLEAAYRLTDRQGAQISTRRIILSTAGVVPAIQRYARERHPFPLYFSLNSAIPAKRRRLMPIEKTYPLDSLVESIRAYIASRDWNPRAVIEYVAIPGENMDGEDIEALSAVFKGMPVILDVIPYNATDGRYRPPTWAEVKRFTTALRRLNLPVKVRFSSGKRTGGGCGQLTAGLLKTAPLEGHHLAPPGIFSDLLQSSVSCAS